MFCLGCFCSYCCFLHFYYIFLLSVFRIDCHLYNTKQQLKKKLKQFCMNPNIVRNHQLQVLTINLFVLCTPSLGSFSLNIIIRCTFIFSIANFTIKSVYFSIVLPHFFLRYHIRCNFLSCRFLLQLNRSHCGCALLVVFLIVFMRVLRM